MAQAAAAQAQVDLDGLNDCLTVCGLRTAALRNGITVREGKRSLEEFGQFQPDDIPELVKSLARNAPTTQRVYYSFTQQKNLQTLSFWVQERLATNQPLDAALWTAAVMKTTGERMLAKKNAPAPTGSVSDIKKFDPLFYDECIDLFKNYLKQRNLAQYVREENPPTTFAKACAQGGKIRLMEDEFMPFCRNMVKMEMEEWVRQRKAFVGEMVAKDEGSDIVQ